MSHSGCGGYLKWLATGRSDPKANIKYVYLFFYGLERRLFFDSQKHPVSKEERLAINSEIRRLLSIYGDDSSFKDDALVFITISYILKYNSD
ncbi:MAG: TerB N-terminal domain-containing protein [Deltaproteobacteria bacterium]|nr:TerB N-terminal domain-containing protein [Deltaproteobacteria bacterium]